MTGKAPTIYDVAKVAGVSHQTVSRFLRDAEGVKPVNRVRVEHALKELGYRPNLTARSLATQRSLRVAALTHEIGQVGPSMILQGVAAEARDAGYTLDFISLDVTDAHAIEKALSAVAPQSIAGLIALPSTDAMSQALENARFTVPTVTQVEAEDGALEVWAGAAGKPLLVNDHHEASASARGLGMLVDHLVELGHSRVFYVGGPPQWISSRNRERATKAALRGHGLAPVGTAHGDWSPESGYRAAAAIPSDGAVTAVIVANDQMALGVMRALEDRGMSVPDDVSVTGFDDIAESRFFRPGLTTVRPDFDSQGRAAFRRLLRLIGEDTPEAPLVIDVSVQLRASTGSARA